MYRVRVLIISKRKELAIKYKKLIEALNQEVFFANDLSEALSIIQKQNVEFIIISDTIKEKISDFIEKIRILTFNFRPIILAISKSNDLKDRIETLEAGADDFLGEEISKHEFQMRFKAHLRRYLESSLNSVTHLLDKKITIKALEKSLDGFNSYLLIKINGIDIYRNFHGEIAAEKVLQTLGAIINSTCAQNDFIGHISDDEFILITNPAQAEKIASFLSFAFDNILNKFYSDDEFKDNFTLQTSDEIQETKEKLMRLNVASIEKDENKKNYKDILNSLNELIKLCLNGESSTYIIDRVKLKGKVEEKKKNRVLVYEPDCALACLIENVCLMNGYEIKTILNEVDFYKIYEEFEPDVVVVDWGNKNQSSSLEIVKNISKNDNKIIFTSSFLNKKEILKAGADLYIPKPYDIDDLASWIKKYLK